MEYKDYYKILGIDKKANQEDIKKAYRKLARQFHPDKNAGNKEAEEKFKAVNEANEVLGDAEKRKKYDELGQNWSKFGSQGQRGGNSPYGGQQFEGDSGDFFGGEGGSGFSDFFEAFFARSTGRQGKTRSQTQFNGQDYEAKLEITLEEAFLGTSRIIKVHEERLRITTKTGAYNGQVLRIRGKGANGSSDKYRGDLYVKVQVVKHPVYTRRGDDLYKDHNIDLYTAVLGGDSIVETINGSIKLKIPAGSQSGKNIRVKGKGMPVYGKEDLYGDLYLQLIIKLPENLTKEEARLFEQLKKLHSEKSSKRNS